MIDTIASRSRLAILRRLDEAPGSSAQELVAATALHLNTVRSHLEALEAAGLVERQKGRTGRPGRPTVRYRLRTPAVPAGDELLPLAGLLADALADFGAAADTSARAKALEWGRAWSRRRRDEGPERALCSGLERLGFAVALEDGFVLLRDCPCPLISASKPELVCVVADAVTDGVLDGTRLRVGSRRHDPVQRRCHARLVAS